MAGDRALSEAMFERPEMMRAGAEGVGMPDLLDELVARAQAAGELREEVHLGGRAGPDLRRRAAR